MSNTFQCDYCGKEFPLDQAHFAYNEDDRAYCEDCVDSLDGRAEQAVEDYWDAVREHNSLEE